MEDKNGKNFVAFPSREKANGEYEDLAFPLNKEFYRELTEALVNDYQRIKEEKQTQDQNQSEQQEASEAQAPAKKGKSR